MIPFKNTCIVVTDDYSKTGCKVNAGNISGGKYAVFVIGHTAEAVMKAWNDIFTEFRRQGYELDETRPMIERYIMEMVNDHLCEICVPVRYLGC